MKSISGKAFAKILERHEWERIDITGSHHKYKKLNKTVIVPIHGNKDLRIGTLKSLMKLSGITERDL